MKKEKIIYCKDCKHKGRAGKGIEFYCKAFKRRMFWAQSSFCARYELKGKKGILNDSC